MEVISTGTSIKMPTGDKIKGRLFNVVGEAIDGINEVENTEGFRFTEMLQNLKNYQQQQKSYSQESK